MYSKMERKQRKNRKRVMDLTGDIPLGTHLCLLYQTKQDLVDIVIPYFAAGLEKDQFCIWVTSSSLSERQTEEGAGETIPDFAQYLKGGQVEIVGPKWHHKHRVFDSQRTLDTLTDKVNRALASGWKGVRVSSDMTWLDDRHGVNFKAYEEEINSLTRKSPVMAICAYPLDRWPASTVMDAIGCHQYYLIKQRGRWEALQSTERSLAEEAIRDSEGYFRALVEGTSDVLWEWDTNQFISYVSPKVRELYGYEPEEMIGRTIFEFMSAEEAKRIVKILKGILKTQRAFAMLQNTMRHNDGRFVTVESSGVPFFDASGRLLGYRGIDRDISRRIEAEEALRNSEERFRALTESTSDWVWELDTNIVHTYANPKVKDLLGYEPEEILGKTPFVFMLPEEAKRMEEEFRVIIESQQPFARLENTMLHKDGRLVVLESSGVPFFDTDGRLLGYRGIDRDVTEQKRLRENMRLYRREVTKAQEEERKRIARELHDETAQALASLSVEIGGIIMMGREKQEKAFQRLEQIPSKIGSIVEEVRRFSHALRPGLLDKFGLVASLRLLAEEMKMRNGLSCGVEIVGFERRISTEPELALFRIVQEALHNVTKHTKATEATIRLTFGKERIKIDVIDNGDGFKLPDVLSNFARRGKFGLMSMNERANLLGGNFSVKSELDKGTTISVDIPQ